MLTSNVKNLDIIDVGKDLFLSSEKQHLARRAERMQKEK